MVRNTLLQRVIIPHAVLAFRICGSDAQLTVRGDGICSYFEIIGAAVYQHSRCIVLRGTLLKNNLDLSDSPAFLDG